MIKDNGDEFYYRNKKKTILHREDGPAIEHANGHKEWRINGKPHREDGPAIEYASGDKAWYINGNLHREDGPAIKYIDGSKSWYLNGECYSEKEFNAKMNICNIKEIVIDGKTYTLTLKD